MEAAGSSETLVKFTRLYGIANKQTVVFKNNLIFFSQFIFIL
jgi:hypothetical protein